MLSAGVFCFKVMQMRILIATGIYPPAIGGPARYAKGLKEAFEELDYQVDVLTYGVEKKLPFGIRHVWYLFRALWALRNKDVVIALDTVSVGFPAVVASFLLGKKIAVRTGGDFLWETYLDERKSKLPLPAFYKFLPRLTFKERVILKVHQFLLDYTDYIVFSTAWQRDIWSGFYNIDKSKVRLIENCYWPKKSASEPKKKIFMGSARDIAMKNLSNLKEAFELAKTKVPDIELDLTPYTPEEYEEKLKNCYAFILTSLGDISPNSIIEAISYNKPFILTDYNGISNRLGGAGIIVDPLNVEEISEAIVEMTKPDRYREEVEKVKKITFVHTYSDIAKEFLTLFNSRK